MAWAATCDRKPDMYSSVWPALFRHGELQCALRHRCWRASLLLPCAPPTSVEKELIDLRTTTWQQKEARGAHAAMQPCKCAEELLPGSYMRDLSSIKASHSQTNAEQLSEPMHTWATLTVMSATDVAFWRIMVALLLIAFTIWSVCLRISCAWLSYTCHSRACM